jgi:glycosyltransferase involved in cell wall biosynthesis
LKRILMATQPSDGGVFDHVARLSAGLAERGQEVLVCGPVDHRRGDLAAEVVPLDLVRSVAPLADARAVAGMARIVRQVRPDLIHAHSSKAGAAARLAHVAYPRTPVVYTPHGYAFAGYFESERERRVYRLAERALGPLASVVLCVCEAERQLACSVGSPRRTRVVHNGVVPVRVDGLHPLVGELSGDGPVIATVTLLRPGKGVETLIDAMPAVLERHPQARLVIAGDGPDRTALEARLARRGVEGAVHMIGETAGPGPVLGGADVFVSPSWAESFPYSVLEAMSLGLPIVATGVGGTREAVEEGVTGRLVPPREPAPLAAALVELLADGDRAASLGEAAARRVKERFTLDRMIEETLAVYGEFER